MSINIVYLSNNRKYLISLFDCNQIILLKMLNNLASKGCEILEVKHISEN